MLNASNIIFSLSEASSGSLSLSKILTQVTDTHREKMIENMSKSALDAASSFLKMAKSTPDFNFMSWKYKNGSPLFLKLIQTSDIPGSSRFEPLEARLVDDAEQLSRTLLKKVVVTILDDFVIKVTQKVIGAVKEVDKASVVLNYSNGDRGMLEASLTFRFKNNSMFSIRTQIVYSFTQDMKQFARFPLTFHDVYLSTGEKMKSPSEAKMKKEFL